MKLLLEFDGVLADPAAMYYSAYRRAAEDVGWSRIAESEFRRLIRTKGREANILSGAKPSKIKAFWAKFDDCIEFDDCVAKLEVDLEVTRSLDRLAHQGECMLITLGGNIERRRELLESSGFAGFFSCFERLNADPRRRPAELTALAGGDRRAIVATASDSIVRPAQEAGLFTVGISTAMCNAKRLHQAGADIDMRDVEELASDLAQGAPLLMKAGLLPPSV